MNIKYGIVKYPADKEFPNKFRPGEMQQSLTLTMDDGTEERLWFSTGRVPHSRLRKGQRAGVMYETNQKTGRQIRKLVTEEGSRPKGTPPTQPNSNYVVRTAMTTEQKREWVMTTIAAYGEIFMAVKDYFKKELGCPLSEESVRTIATSIAINFDKKFPNETLKLADVEAVPQKQKQEQVSHQDQVDDATFRQDDDYEAGDDFDFQM